MAKPTYYQVSDKINELTRVYKEKDPGYEYAATTGCLASILSQLLSGETSRKDAFEQLESAIARVSAR